VDVGSRYGAVPISAADLAVCCSWAARRRRLCAATQPRLCRRRRPRARRRAWCSPRVLLAQKGRYGTIMP